MGSAKESTSLVKRTGQWIAYALFRCVEGVMRLLPLIVIWWTGRALGTVAYYVAGKYRQLALHNLRIAYGREKNPDELRHMAQAHFKSLFANVLCGFKLPLMNEADLCRHVRSEGIERAQAAFDAGRPILNLVLHASCWEILTQVPSAYVRGHKAGAIYQSLRNPWLNALVLRRREKLGYALFDRQAGFNAPMKFMRECGQIGVLVDQHAGYQGLWCPFFDRLASTTTIAALMAMRTNAVVLPMMVYDDGPARWRLVCAPEVKSAEAEQTADGLTIAINAAVEQLIREQPTSWFWVHERWKTSNRNFLLLNSSYRRGIAFPEGYDPSRLQPFELLIRSPNWLGDACMAFPMVRAIKRGRPDMRITILGPDKLEDLWRSMPEVSDYIGKPAKEGLFAVARRIKATGVHFDAAVLCTNSTRSTLELWLGGVPHLVGLKGSFRKKLLTYEILEPKVGFPKHQAHLYMFIAKRVGADVDQAGLWDAGTPPVSTDGTIRVGVCAGAEYGPAKRWPLERFAAVVNQISAQHAQFRWQLFGAPGEKEMGEKLSSMIHVPHENFVGKTRLSELIAKLRECQLLLTNDTGTMHLAAALGIPTVSIFGSTCPIATGPLGERHTVIQHKVSCSPCFERECPFGHYECMTKVTPEEVAAAVLKASGVTG
ncbi:lipopolysaccharide heptosyltransferase II [Prosthecobacter sp.]|uniref:lipopolysaccharide heptosyltransferase II n=1 Tax=Prosthecobacter sp. TaxID=1965333 RepID=UPI001DCF0022|nr:lipopolysaccharide heptosyltransferase II [Prosthecobacter sp.]MCB1277686.1 lipopolysaccharide heptosyltransferase II [Prosthecobacter sp.]